MLRKIVGVLIVLITFLIQACFGKSIALANISPNLLLIVVVSGAFLNGQKSGILLGFFSGILLDIYYGMSGIIGFNAILFIYIGYIAGWFHEVFYDDDIKLPLLLIAIADFVCNFLHFVFGFLLKNKLDLPFYFKRIMLPELVYTVVVAIFLYKLLFFINKLVKKQEVRSEGKFV